MNKLINPSPQERTPEQRGTKEKHSPWTAPRDKKKKRSTYDHQLPAIVDDCHQNHGPGREAQRQEDLQPRFVSNIPETSFWEEKHGTTPHCFIGEPKVGGNVPGVWAQGVSFHATSSAQAKQTCIPALPSQSGAAVAMKRPSSAGACPAPSTSRPREMPAAQRGFLCDPFEVFQAGSGGQARQQQGSGSGRGPDSGAAQQSPACQEDKRKVHSCDFPAAGGPPPDPITLDACSTDFASVAARRPAFQAAFYFGARRQPNPIGPVLFGEHGPLAAGAQRFSSGLPHAQPPQREPLAAATSTQQQGGATPCQQLLQPRPLESGPKGAQRDGCSEGGTEAMEVCSSGGQGEGTPQARQGLLPWPASLQKMRRGGSRSPKDPPALHPIDMQPLGRHISSAHAAVGCLTPGAGDGISRDLAPGEGQPRKAFAEGSENAPGRANFAVVCAATEGTPFAEGVGRGRGPPPSLCGGGRNVGRGSPLAPQQQQQLPSVLQGSRQAPEASSRAMLGRLRTWQALAGCSPMQTDAQPTRLCRLQAVMEMSTLDASLDGPHMSRSITQLEVQQEGGGGIAAQVLQWQMAVQRDTAPSASCTSSDKRSAMEHRAGTSPCSSIDSHDINGRRIQLSSGMTLSGEADSPASMLMMSGGALAQTFSPFSQGTPTPQTIDEEEFKCSQASNGDMAPMKPPGGVLSAKDAAKDSSLATFNDRLHEAVENGDVELVGQAWQEVRAGTVQPDIDSLNALLKTFCRVNGNPPPGEAEELVAAASKRGCMPNAATCHQLSAIWWRHEQMACPDEERALHVRDPYVTP